VFSVALVRSGALDGEAGAGEAAGAAVVGEAPLLHQPDHQITSARPARAAAAGAGREERRVEWAASLCLV